MNNRLIKSNDAGGGGGCTNTVDLYNPFPDGGGVTLYQLNGDATDVSGNYDGTATNVTYGAGQFGQAGVFNGSSSEINLNSAVLPASIFSVSMWFNLSTINRTNYLITQYILAGGSNGRFEFAVDSTNNFVIYLEGGALTFTTSVSLSANTWYNVVLIKNGASGWACYLDSQSLGTNSDTRNIYTGDNTRLGKRVGLSSGVLYGSLDQVRIFNRALRPYEVEALYTEEYCTPTIVPSQHFNTVTYTGNRVDASTTNPQTVGFQPDLTWVKIRTQAYSHLLMDSVRGGDFALYSNDTAAETGINNNFGGIDFVPNGIVVNSSVNAVDGLNKAGDEFVAWNFKAGGAAVTNTDGTITSQVSANTEAGFSIVNYTGNGVNGNTVGHGLNSTPDVVIVKDRDISFNWHVYHSAVMTGGDAKFLRLNTTDTILTDGIDNVWDSGFNNQTFGIGAANSRTNNSMIAYCFAEVEGFSNFGSYVGNGSTSGNVVVTGFEPAFVMVKRTDASGNSWLMVDNKRVAAGNEKHELFANTSTAESGTGYDVAFLENGFQMQTTTSNANASGGSYIYMAFAADPTAVEPTLEDSFNTVTWTGTNTGAGRDITGVGFQPDLVWSKGRTQPYSHQLYDSVRGAKPLASNTTQAETGTTYGYLDEFLSDGFSSLAGSADNSYFNSTGVDYVAWAWKGAEIPAINSNGSIPSVVSANPAAGFSIVSYTGKGSNATIGHGLNTAPSVYIVKNRDVAIDWAFETTLIDGSLDYLFLNSTAAKGDAVEAVPNETIFNIDGSVYLGANNNKFIAYCFAEVAGFSKFGSYPGGTLNRQVDCQFEPAFVMIKNTTNAASWAMFDNKRGVTGGTDAYLAANLSDAEADVGARIEFNSTGFELTTTNANYNGASNTYIFMAFANQF